MDIIVKSDNVSEDSHRVFYSDGIGASTDIHHSKWIVGCNQIYESQMITDSNCVYHGYTVDKSNNIVHGTNILRCRNLYDVKDAKNCGELEESSHCEDVWFSALVESSKHCLFCYNGSNMNYMMFNKPIDPEVFESTLKMYQMIITKQPQPELVKSWNKNYIIDAKCNINANWSRHYMKYTEDFKKWIKTLPNYDSTVMCQITNDNYFIV